MKERKKAYVMPGREFTKRCDSLPLLSYGMTEEGPLVLLCLLLKIHNHQTHSVAAFEAY